MGIPLFDGCEMCGGFAPFDVTVKVDGHEAYDTTLCAYCKGDIEEGEVDGARIIKVN